MYHMFQCQFTRNVENKSYGIYLQRSSTGHKVTKGATGYGQVFMILGNRRQISIETGHSDLST